MVELDVFGPVEPSYETEFRRLLNEAPEARYAGCVAAEHSVRAICDYDALLFPTEWIGEGMPGTIIDAMSASLPVVASRWTYYGEMLQDGVTGLGYDFDRPEQLRPTIEEFLALPAERVEAMRRASFTRSRQYAPEAVFCQVARALAGSAR